MTAAIKVFPQPETLAQALAGELERESKQAKKAGRSFGLVLAGGSTPHAVYEVFARAEFEKSIAWDAVHFFWGDERCVPPDHEDSNFRMARWTLLDPIGIRRENIHRIQGENEPSREASRYAEEIRRHCRSASGETPRFDWILLGLGIDGHTASLFPGAEPVEDPSGICGVAVHPGSGQKRITLTLKVLNRAKRISFIVTGGGKAEVVAEILNQSSQSKRYPASQVHPRRGTLEWLLDTEAALQIRE